MTPRNLVHMCVKELDPNSPVRRRERYLAAIFHRSSFSLSEVNEFRDQQTYTYIYIHSNSLPALLIVMGFLEFFKTRVRKHLQMERGDILYFWSALT